MNLIQFCNSFYHSLYIPVYLYKEHKFALSYPAQTDPIFSPAPYLQTLQNSSASLSYCFTSFHSLYGCITLHKTNEMLVFGPVNSLPYTNEQLFRIRKEYSISADHSDEFNLFMNAIPQMRCEQFLQLLSFLNYTLTNELISIQELITENTSSEFERTIQENYFSNSYVFSDSVVSDNSVQLEQKFLNYIEQGDLNGLHHYFSSSMSNPHIGHMATDNLRQAKNTFIVTVTLATRAAIKGGLSAFHAYRLSDTYIQQVETLRSIDAIDMLSRQAILDFTERTRSTGQPLKNASTDMSQVITYVQEHMNEHISVESIAAEFGYNRSYLSRKFKQDLGFDLGAFINRCKLETAKSLLTYTNKSLSDISISLCFSSQSHFQNLFKKQFGLTPMQYRRQTKQ